jgi:type II secretory pathway component PulJ
MIEYLIATVVIAIGTGIAVRVLGKAMSQYFSFLVAFISLPIP